MTNDILSAVLGSAEKVLWECQREPDEPFKQREQYWRDCAYAVLYSAKLELENLDQQLRTSSDALADALRVVLNDLMYKDHSQVIDLAKQALAAYEATKAKGGM